MGRFLEFFIRQRLTLSIVVIFIILSGIYLLKITPKEAFPFIDLDVVMITTSYPGAQPQDVETLITKEIEEKLKGIENIDRIDSITVEGLSVINIRLNPDASFKDKVDARRQIVNAVEVAKNELPLDAEKPVISDMQVHRPLITVGVYGGDVEKAVEDLEKIYLSIPEVASVEKSGYYKKEIWVEVDPYKLKQKNLSIIEVINAIRNANLIAPGGRLTGTIEKPIVTFGKLTNIEDIKDVIVKSNPEGMVVRVKDIANVFERTERKKYISRINGQSAAKLRITSKKYTDAIKVVEEIKKVTNEYSEKTGIKIVYSDDITVFVKRRLGILLSNGTIGAIIVALVLGLFLNIKIVIIAIFSVLTSFLMGFIFLYLKGYTINLLSMFAFIFTLGMLVDSAIVMSEYFERRLVDTNSYQAAQLAVTRMFFPVFAAILTNMVGFMPLAFMTGVIGKFMKIFPVITIVLFTTNLIQTLFILPSQLTYITKATRPLYVDKLIKFLEALYENVVKKTLERRLFSTLLIISIPIIIFTSARLFLKFVLFPVTVDEFYITFELKPQSPIEKTLEVGKKIEEFVYQMGIEIDSVITDIGLSVGKSGNELYPERASYKGQVKVALKPWAKNVEEIINKKRDELLNYAQKIGAVDIMIFKRRAGPPVGKDVEVRIVGEDFGVLKKITDSAVEFLKNQNGVISAGSSWSKEVNKVKIKIDRTRLAMAGVGINEVSQAIRAVYGGEKATTIRASNDINVVVKFKEEFEKNLQTINEIEIPSIAGRLIPLKNIVDIKYEDDFLFIERSFGNRVLKITADIDRKITTSREVNKKLEEFLKNEIKKYPGYTYDFWGEERDRIESVNALIKMMIVAIFINFIVLVALFRSLTAPFVIVTSILFAFAGVFLALLVHGMPISMLSMIAMIGLTGVVINNAILIVDTAIRNIDSGMSKYDSIINACKARLRPILLTSITTFAGVMPVAYGIGGSDPFLKPLALTFGWGFIFSTIFTLLFTPIVSSFLLKAKA
ncbi:MAG: efflux RND transporter permease subunit [bacterium]|nr:efflux RND transporter permease subunit [bacterium]